jgi:hypothetical protein
VNARQLELFRVKKPPGSARTTRAPLASAAEWGLFVNECGIFASGIARDRWLDFTTLRAKDDRLTMLWLGPAGGEWHVMCGTREAAVEARDLFLEVGFHKGHVKVARLSACMVKVAERRRRVDDRIAGAAS